MQKKNKYIFTLLSVAIVALLILYSYKKGSEEEYAGLSLFIRFAFWYLISVAAGTVSLFVSPLLRSPRVVALDILLGALNVLIGAVGVLFPYFELEKFSSTALLFSPIPIVVGLFLFRRIYCRRG